MPERLILDQTALATFEVCPRRFQLRYLQHLPWPSSPLDRHQSQAVERGQQFHRLAERHFLGLPVDVEAVDDDVLREWWLRFKHSKLEIPDGKRWPEHRLTIPAGSSFLHGRFDLLVLGIEEGEPFAHIYDWKTSRPRATTDLRLAWQTHLYLALVAESGQALFPKGYLLQPERISMTYWYPSEADQPRRLTYSEEEHHKNWAAILELVTAIEAYRAQEIWPLTNDWSHCRHCMYQVYCGRQEAGTSLDVSQDGENNPERVESAVLLEPQTP